LQDLHREKSEFMRKVAHELRAPLSAIQSCLQVALEYFGEKLAGKPRELIERAERRSGGLIALVRDLLNLSRANEVLQKANFEPLDLGEILESVIELIKPEAQKKQIQISSRLGEDDLSFKGDNGALEEVFTNLLSNAVKYSPSESLVQVRVESTPREIEIAFSDQGIGIPAEDMELLFSEFFRSSNAKAMQVEGTGLGLALSKKIVEFHGGQIEVESELGKGSCFRVKLPR
jgi:signal transduction histidine kinase